MNNNIENKTLSNLNILSEPTNKINNKNLSKENNFKITYVEIDELIPNPNNKFGLRDIEELADAIKENGLNSPLLVNEIDAGYQIIAGHRRHAALKLLIKQGHFDKKNIPVKIIKCIDDFDSHEKLILDNALSRDINDWESLNLVIDLKNIYEEKKKLNEFNGDIAEFIAKKLAYSRTKVIRYISIDSKLLEEFKLLIKNDKLGLTLAYEIAQIPKEYQEKLLSVNYIDKCENISIKKFKDFRKNIVENENKDAIFKNFLDCIDDFECEMNSSEVKSDNKKVKQWDNILSKDSHNVQKKIIKLLKNVEKLKKDNVKFNSEMIDELSQTLEFVNELRENITSILTKY